GGQVVDRSVGAIIVAEDHVRESNLHRHGLAPSERVTTLTGLAETLAGDGDALAGVEKAVFITGVGHESNPVIAGEIMNAALDLQNGRGVRAYVLTGNLKVASNGLEALRQKAEDAGAVFIKFEGGAPVIQQDPDGRARIEFQDEVLRRPFRLSPDLCVVDESILPSPDLRSLAEVLELKRDRAGFVQADNVHRNPVFTNRKGIFAAGPSRCVQSRADHLVDAENAALAVLGLLNGDAGGRVNTAEIDPGHCVRCLTCVRVCNYRAIRLRIRPEVAPDACEGCGVCAAECPGLAISIDGLGPDIASNATAGKDLTIGDDGSAPRIVAFCCARSAAQAGEMAAAMNHPTPPGLKV
ncbi:MAG: 4Fe-4S dicluster domain-containing protein, partial [Desulfobacterales bacterium]|nr:4Fe-4S dicluster domain-containing protein [Desulfobacterales bacterium]